MNEIVLDEQNQNNLRALQSMISEATQKYQIILQSILNFNKVEGEWKLSPDGAKIVKVEKPKKDNIIPLHPEDGEVK